MGNIVMPGEATFLESVLEGFYEFVVIYLLIFCYKYIIDTEDFTYEIK